MNFVKLERREQFDKLKKGDIIIVRWRERAVETRKGNPITYNKIHGIVNGTELLLNIRNNSYFDYIMYLNGESTAEEAYTVTV
jgi:hypothetical protein